MTIYKRKKKKKIIYFHFAHLYLKIAKPVSYPIIRLTLLIWKEYVSVNTHNYYNRINIVFFV